MAERELQQPQLVTNHTGPPPRVESTDPLKKLEPGTSKTILQSKDSLRILIDMGFSKHRAYVPNNSTYTSYHNNMVFLLYFFYLLISLLCCVYVHYI